VYIEPVYIQVAAGGGQEPYPILQRVLVSFGSEIGVARTLDEALAQVFGAEQTGEQQGQEQGENQQENQQQQQQQETSARQTAINEAKKAYDDATKALQSDPPNWEEFGRAQQRLDEALEKLENAGVQAQSTPAPTGTPSPTPSPASTPAPSASPTGG